MHEPLYETLCISKDDTAKTIIENCISNILTTFTDIKLITAQAAHSDKKTDLELSNALQMLVENTDSDNTFKTLKKAFLTAANEPRKSIATVFVKNEIPTTAETLHSIAETIVAALQKISSIQLIKNSYHLFKIGNAVLEVYESMKRQRGVIDFDDQIEKNAPIF